MSKGKKALLAVPGLSIEAEEAIASAVQGQSTVDTQQGKIERKWVLAADLMYALGFRASMIAGKTQVEGPRKEVEAAVVSGFSEPIRALVALGKKDLAALSVVKRKTRDTWVCHKSSYVNRIAGYLRSLETAQADQGLSDEALAAKELKAKWERRIATLTALAKQIKADDDVPDEIDPTETAKRLLAIVGHITKGLIK